VWLKGLSFAGFDSAKFSFQRNWIVAEVCNEELFSFDCGSGISSAFDAPACCTTPEFELAERGA
jgi:hypothetical protein